MVGKTAECFGVHKKSYDLDVYSVTKQVESSDADNEKEPLLKCRYIVTFVGFWMYFLFNGFRLNLSVSIVAMINHSALAREEKIISQSCPDLLLNSSSLERTSRHFGEEGEFTWSPEVQSYILASIFAGYIIFMIPASRIIERIGFKWVLFGSFVTMSLITLLTPMLSWMSVNAMIAGQFLRGFSQVFALPAGSLIAANWYPTSDRGLLLPIMRSGVCLGGALGSVISGYLCDSAGRWPSSFYTFGAFGLLVSVLIALFVFESPNDHPRISKAELHFILSHQETVLTKRRPNPPWCSIITSVHVYSLIYAVFGQYWINGHFLTVHSTFLSTIMHYPIAQNGLLVSFSFLAQFVGAQAAAWLTKLMFKRKICSVDSTRKFWNTMACFGSSACLLGIYFAGCNRSLSVIFSVLAMGFSGMAFAGCVGVAADMSPTFAAIIQGLCQTFGSLSCVFEPLLAGYLTEEAQTLEQWNKVFLISIGVVLSSGIVFAVFGSAEVQPWNYVQDEKTETSGDEKVKY